MKTIEKITFTVLITVMLTGCFKSGFEKQAVMEIKNVYGAELIQYKAKIRFVEVISVNVKNDSTREVTAKVCSGTEYFDGMTIPCETLHYIFERKDNVWKIRDKS